MDDLKTLAAFGKGANSEFDRRTIQSWAADNVTLGSNYTITGKFSLAHSPWLKAPFDSLSDDHVRLIHLRAPVRSGKTLLADVWLPWIICNDPGPCMWNLDTDASAKDHAKLRIQPNLRAIPALQPLMPSSRFDLNTQEIHFQNGMPLFIQGPAESHLQQKGVRYQVNDELWNWPVGRIYQAYARVKDFEKMGMSKVLNISQAGLQDDDEDIEFNKGHILEWEVACSSCNQYFVPSLEFNQRTQDDRPIGFHYADDEAFRDSSGDFRVYEMASTIKHHCPHCGAISQDSPATRNAWNATGRYRHQQPNQIERKHTRLSYHFESSVVRPWIIIVTEYLHALNARRRGVLDQIIAWFQKERAVPWTEILLFQANAGRTFEPLEVEWSEEVVRYFTLDFQDQDVWWGTIRAWNKQGESRRLWFGRITTEGDIIKLAQQFRVKPAHVGMDSGYKTKRVYGMCVRNGWIAFKGDSDPEFRCPEKRPDGRTIHTRKSWTWFHGDPEFSQGSSARSHAFVVRWSNPTIKDRLDELIARGLWLEPKTDPHDEKELIYKKQMTAEYKRQKRNPITGAITTIRVCPSRNDHLHDCAAEQVVLATIHRILPDIETSSSATT